MFQSLRSSVMKCVLALHIIGFFSIGLSVGAQIRQQDHTSMTNPYRTIESASKLETSDDPESVRRLAHEVLNSPHIFKIPKPLMDLVEEKLTNSEIHFINKAGPGVSERQVLDLMNYLAQSFGTPEYSRTTELQVRSLRMTLAIASPHFMGSGISSTSMNVGDHIEPLMSPLQAAHLVCVLIDQKVINEDYQDSSVDPISSDQLRRKQLLSSASQQNSSSAPSAVVVRKSNSKHTEMRNAIYKHIETMTMVDAFDLLEKVMSNLNLE